jgi:hypothetical protein
MNELFGIPERKDTTLNKVGRFLSGFGAGYQGRGAEFLAQQDQRQQQLDERRQKAMAQDAMRVYSSLSDGKYDDAIELIDDRVKSINELGGDASDTLEIRNLIVSGRLDEAQQELGGFLELAMQNGLIEAPKAPEAYTLGPGQVRFEGGRQIAAVPANQSDQGPLTPMAKLRADLAAGRITQGDFDAEMARINQPTTQAQPAPVTDIGRINRAVQTGEITPEQGDTMLNAAIQKQEIELATGQAKVDETANRDQMILGEMTRLYDLSGSLLANKSGLARSTGPVSARMPTLRQDASDFKADLEEFRNLLTMSNLGRMTGVLSELDIRLIASASSGISETASEERMREKIIAIRERIIPKLIAAGVLPSDGSAPMGNVPPIPSQYQGMITDSEWQAMTPEERAAF